MTTTRFAGLAVGCIGGCVSIIGMALYYQHAESTITTIGILLLLAAMFFGAAGGFTKYGPWTPKALTIVVAVAGVATLGEVFEVLFGAVEIVLAIIMAVLAYIGIPTEN